MKMLAIFAQGRLIPVEHNLLDVNALAKQALYRTGGTEAILVDQNQEHRTKSTISCNCSECREAIKRISYSKQFHRHHRRWAS